MEKIKTTLTKIVNNKDTYKALFGLAVLFVAYQAFVVVPNNKLEAARIEKITNEMKYKMCVIQAENKYDRVWDGNCDNFSVGKDGDSCLLPGRIADDLREMMESEKDACVTLYK